MTNKFSSGTGIPSIEIDNASKPPVVSIKVSSELTNPKRVYFKGSTEKNSNTGKTSLEINVCGAETFGKK